LEKIEERSGVLLEKKKTARFFDKERDSQEVISLVDELRAAIVCYQVSGNRMVWSRVNVHR